MRQRVYSRWVKQGRMSRDKANRQYLLLKAALELITTGLKPTDQIKTAILGELNRELDYRKGAYPRMISSGKLNFHIGQKQIIRLQAVTDMIRNDDIAVDNQQSLF